MRDEERDIAIMIVIVIIIVADDDNDDYVGLRNDIDNGCYKAIKKLAIYWQ